MLTVRDIVKDRLIKDGYDGLYSENGECACEVDDLFPMCEQNLDCTAGHKIPCDCGDCDYHIGEKPCKK